MRISLIRLAIRNFKGIRELVIDFSHLTEIFGDNATGKTTIFDAFDWLMFDKDSFNRKDFAIKPQDADGKVLHGLSPEVEGTLTVDGRTTTLRKVYSEKWVKKRGSATEEFTGHTTDYFVNGVPVKKKEYEDAVGRIVIEDIFKLVTSPLYFNESLDWRTRRKILLEVCGDVTDLEVIQSNPDLAKLPSILLDRSIDDHRKVIASRRREINDQLQKIPVRVDEAERAKPVTTGQSEAEVDALIRRLSSDVELKEAELSRLQTGGEIAFQEKRLRELDAELLDIVNRSKKAAMDVTDAQARKVRDLQNRLYTLQDDVMRAQGDIDRIDKMIVAKKDEVQLLREQWSEVNASSMDPHIEDSCPTCKQSLPADEVQAAHDRAVADFNRSKSEKLEKVAAKGVSANAEISRLDGERTANVSKLDECNAAVASAHGEVAEASAELERLQASIQDVSTNPEYVSKQKEMNGIKKKLLTLRQSVLDDVQRVRNELMDLRDELRLAERQKAAFTQILTLDDRIVQLKAQERQLAAEYERLEEELYLTEEFVKTKVRLLENRINNKFRHARFRLFEDQINGGLAETCETMFQGVPYSSGLNNAARINVGLDIINTLSEHYGVTAPIFVDNAESVTRLAETASQLIKLTVPTAFDNLPFDAKQRLISLYGDVETARRAWEDQNKQLRVETHQSDMKEAV